MIRLKDLRLVGSRDEMAAIPPGKTLINTINAHSYNVARKDRCSDGGQQFVVKLQRCAKRRNGTRQYGKAYPRR